jgi:hypothetical protein
VLKGSDALVGTQLVLGVRANQGSVVGMCFDLDRLSDPVRRQLGIQQLVFTTATSGAAGGTLELGEHSPIGACNQTIPTTAGQTAATLSQAALERCVSAYRAAATTCVLDGVTAACHGILVGHVPDGQPCADVAACDRAAGPKVCQKIQGMGELGTCQTPPRGKSGDPCALSCALDTNCSVTASSPAASYPTTLCYEEDGLYCQSGYSCVPLVADGSTCSGEDACRSASYCDGETCVSRPGPGDACQFGPDCGSGFACVDSHCAPAPFAFSSSCEGYPPAFD